jgi:DUF2075 family protein/SOS-response transcriptional repressor LexA/predicted GIY-YIG superfamily endonuclease
MKGDNIFQLERLEFNQSLFNNLHANGYAKDLWPLVYILSDGKVKEAYVGETTDAIARMTTHLKNDSKAKLSIVHLITSKTFNKSATLDIESNLIKYISGDGQYRVTNANVGLANHTYYQKKEVYWDLFKNIWSKLKSEGVAKKSIAQIDNSDLFKYSPYKSLSPDQKEGLTEIIKNILNKKKGNFIIEGGAGTGKTILAVFLFKLLNTEIEDFNFKEFGDDEEEFIELVLELKTRYPKPSMALVIPMSSFRKTMQKVFKNIKGLTTKMVIGPAELANRSYDILIVDEAHRLRKRVNLGSYFHAFDNASNSLNFDKHVNNELDWVVKQGAKNLLFYDEGQSIKPSDVNKADFDLLKSQSTTLIQKLTSQLRVLGGKDYVAYIDQLLHCQLKKSAVFESNKYEFFLFDSIEQMILQIKKRNEQHGLARLIAGFAWKWISEDDKSLYDIIIGDQKLQWNFVKTDWINSDGALDQVGCIHTTQGYDLNYAGIIFGEEISYDKQKEEIVIRKENYQDKNGKNSVADLEKLKSYILNVYSTIMLRGIKGTFVYVCDPDLREYFAMHIMTFEKTLPFKILKASEIKPYINSVPLYNFKVAAGLFTDSQDPSDFEWIELPKPYKPSKEYFVCRISGNSMNKIIPDGSWALFKKDPGGSRHGKTVLVQHYNIQDTDYSLGYTIKKYASEKEETDEDWKHKRIVLSPNSDDESYQPIVLEEDEIRDLKVVGVFVGVLT